MMSATLLCSGGRRHRLRLVCRSLRPCACPHHQHAGLLRSHCALRPHPDAFDSSCSAASSSVSAWAVSGPPALRWSRRYGLQSTVPRRLPWCRAPGPSAMRSVQPWWPLVSAAFRMARGFLRRNRSSPHHALDTAKCARSRKHGSGDRPSKAPDTQAFPRCIGYSILYLRQHERCGPLRLLGTVHLDAALSLDAPIAEGGRGLSIAQTSAVDHRDAGRALFLATSFSAIMPTASTASTPTSASCLSPPCWCRVFAFVRSPDSPAGVGPLVGFFGTGYFSGFSVITSELFPTSLRGSAMGFVYNIGRIVSAAAPYFIGHISEHAGLRYALSSTSAAFLLAALIATGLRQTRNPQLLSSRAATSSEAWE